MSSPGAQSPGFGEALQRLRSAQKSSKGGPPYSLFVNRPLGRVFAAAAHRLGRTPDQVTYLSALCTFAGIAAIALVRPSLLLGVLVALALIVGYALDSADGQLARLRGGGSMAGEWLDHTIDSIKVVVVHVAVLVSFYRYFGLDARWLLVPVAFAVASSVHFFGMILIDLLARMRRATLGVPNPAPAPADLPKTLLKLPTDYGLLCVAFVMLGLPVVFFWVYTFLAVATVGYTVLVIGKWRRDVMTLDALQPTSDAPDGFDAASGAHPRARRVRAGGEGSVAG